MPFDKPLAAIALGESKQQLSPQENIMPVWNLKWKVATFQVKCTQTTDFHWHALFNDVAVKQMVQQILRWNCLLPAHFGHIPQVADKALQFPARGSGMVERTRSRGKGHVVICYYDNRCMKEWSTELLELSVLNK